MRATTGSTRDRPERHRRSGLAARSVRRRVAAGLLAAAVFAIAAVVVSGRPPGRRPHLPKPCGDGRHPRRLGESAPTRRSATRSATRVTWHTTDVFDGAPDPANACQWFSPDPFGPQGNVVPEGWGYPLEVAIRGARSIDVLAQETDPELADVLVEEELFVDGHRAVRLEYETLIDVIGGNRTALRVRDRARRRDDADRAHDGDAGCGGCLRGEQDRSSTTPWTPCGSSADVARRPSARSARPASAGRDILLVREAAGPAGLLPLPPTHLRSRQARRAVGARGGRRRAGPDLSGLPARPPRLAGEPGPVPGLRLDPFVRHPGRGGVPSVWACRWWWSGRLAQLEERRPYKAKVGGSSPSAPTGNLVACALHQSTGQYGSRDSPTRLCAGRGSCR